ncbi:serine/threonine-protein kinase ZRK1-like [Euphorbia lathyris]|uniref:serine/threonine-protein kinase ZRK1-like n=1 Tax=Euphorbia lathyris TaxID=212925 RepID=UPI0033137D36
MISCLSSNKVEEKDEAMENLIRNGGMLLEKSTAFTNGKGHSIGRSFSLRDLNIATHNFDRNLEILYVGTYALYKGSLRDRLVIVKKYLYTDLTQACISDIVFSSQMKVHKNVLTLLGCCLESSIPILVFEYAEKESLDRYIFNRGNRANFLPLSWKIRLKIAVDLANVIAYLHTAFSRPVVHRDIKLSSILLDEDYGAKVSDFSCSIALPEGETHIKDQNEPRGSYGYIAPEILESDSMFNEKVDVYSYGLVLLVLLTRRYRGHPPPYGAEYLDLIVVKNLMENDGLEEIIDPTIVEEGPWPGKEQHLKAFTTLALHCTREDPEDRPEITDVGKQIRQMYQSLI